MNKPLRLRSDALAVVVVPDNGADIASIVDSATGIEVLFQSPWGRRTSVQGPSLGDTQLDWIAHYGGGWQQLIPNAGAAREVDGVLRGFHGEAALAAWTVDSADDSSASLSVNLITAPLRLTRSLRIDGASLVVSDTITNCSDDSVAVMWVQHPGFGAPFIDEHCILTTGARTVYADAVAPGNVLLPDTVGKFPLAPGVHGQEVDLSAVPGPTSGRSVFGALTDFDGAWFAIDSPSAGFGIRLDWDASLFPHAWLWQECHASGGFPWFRRAYVIAVEPANVLPGEPSAAVPGRGQAPQLPGGQTWSSELRLSRTG